TWPETSWSAWRGAGTMRSRGCAPMSSKRTAEAEGPRSADLATVLQVAVQRHEAQLTRGVLGGEDHPLALDPAQFDRLEVRDEDQALADHLIGRVVGLDARDDGARLGAHSYGQNQ